MHPGDNAVGLEHEVAIGRRRECRGIIEQTEGSGMGGERFEVARDEPVLAGLRCLRFLHAESAAQVTGVRPHDSLGQLE